MLNIKNLKEVFFVAIFSILVVFSSNAFANVVSDTYHGAKKGAKKVYHKGKKAAKSLTDAEVRGLKKIIKIEGKILKTEYDVASYLGTRPVYFVADYVLKKGQRPPKRPDLVISKMFLDKNGHIIVTIKNQGKGFLVMRAKHKTVNLYFKLNGRDYGGVTHKEFDPRNRLIKPNGKVTYKTRIKIKKETVVTAKIDDLNSVIESNKKNNVLTLTLPKKSNIKPVTKMKPVERNVRTKRKDHTIHQASGMTLREQKERYTPKPDLIIDKLFLSRECKVIVHVKNIGKGSVDNSAWTDKTPQSTSVYLFRNGKKWGGATLYGFDKRRRLQKPNGTVSYVSNLKVNGMTSITAVIDMTKQVKESNENNNELTKELTCNK